MPPGETEVTLTVAEAPNKRDRTIVWGITVSVLIHALVMLPQVKDLFPGELELSVPEEVIIEPLEFELVSPPPNPTPTSQPSRYLSTVSSAARDRMDSEEDTDTPRGEGIVPFPDQPSTQDGAEGGGESEVPPLPEETSDLGEAFKRSKFLDQQSPQREQSLPEQNPDFRNEGSARASIGGISLNTTAWDFAPYLLDLKYRIKQHWIPPMAFTALGSIHGYTWVRFRIYPNGKMEALEVIETEGHESLHRSSVGAVSGAAPFRPLPEDFPEDYLEITFGFYYLLPGDEHRFFKKE
jgi:outer membrane biosynthesis protein TonB